MHHSPETRHPFDAPSEPWWHRSPGVPLLPFEPMLERYRHKPRAHHPSAIWRLHPTLHSGVRKVQKEEQSGEAEASGGTAQPGRRTHGTGKHEEADKVTATTTTAKPSDNALPHWMTDERKELRFRRGQLKGVSTGHKKPMVGWPRRLENVP